MTDPRRMVYMDLDDLASRFHPENPKAHDLDEIRASMLRHGYMDAVILCERTGLLASGHGRCEVLLDDRDNDRLAPEGITVTKAGKWRVPVQRGWESKDDVELKAAVIAANRLVERGGWITDKLVPMLSEVGASPLGLIGVGYTPEQVVQFVTKLAAPSEFPAIDPANLSTEHKCPSCGYEWSGSATPGG